jgi:hypothetical protein
MQPLPTHAETGLRSQQPKNEMETEYRHPLNSHELTIPLAGLEKPEIFPLTAKIAFQWQISSNKVVITAKRCTCVSGKPEMQTSCSRLRLFASTIP